MGQRDREHRWSRGLGIEGILGTDRNGDCLLEVRAEARGRTWFGEQQPKVHTPPGP